MNINFKSTFHGIGQGLFYSLIVNEHVIVYDCGSETNMPPRHNILNTYINGAMINEYFKDGKIDLFIISHFHNDHINGIKKLHSKGIDIREFVMPYLYKEIRWLFWGGKTTNDFDFINDPVGYLKGLYPQCKITFIKNSTDLDNDDFINANESGDDDNKPFDIMGWYGNTIEKDEWQDDLSVIFQTSLSSYRIPYWKFKFSQDSFPDKINISKIRKAIKDSKIDIGNDPSKILDVIDIMKQNMPSNLRNETSLICCHGPVAHKNNIYIYFEIIISKEKRYTQFSCCSHIHNENVSNLDLGIPLFHLLSGDAEISDRFRYEDNFMNDLGKVLVFQIPHHGSAENWHNWFVHSHPNTKFWLYSRGDPNRFNHPTAHFPTIVNKNKIDLIQGKKFELEGFIHLS